MAAKTEEARHAQSLMVSDSSNSGKIRVLRKSYFLSMEEVLLRIYFLILTSFLFLGNRGEKAREILFKFVY